MNGPASTTAKVVAPLHALGNATTQHAPEWAANGATPHATDGATPSLKALARQVLERNAARNNARNTAPAVALHGPYLSNTPAQQPEPELAEAAAIIGEGSGAPPELADAYAALVAMPCPRGVIWGAWLELRDIAGQGLDAWLTGQRQKRARP